MFDRDPAARYNRGMARNQPTDREILTAAFKDAGVRLTSQRELAWRTFRSHPAGLTITEAVGELEPHGIGLSTVYRTVSLFEQLGLLKRVHDANGEHRYVAGRPGHFHPLVCRSCGTVVEFESCGMEAIEKKLSRETGFAIEGHDLEVHGTCPKCQE
jgi:Fe2+ or Zn2+ uptake regulation protein